MHPIHYRIPEATYRKLIALAKRGHRRPAQELERLIEEEVARIPDLDARPPIDADPGWDTQTR